MNLLQTYQAEQAMHDTHASIIRELRERQDRMQALARFTGVRPRFQFVRRIKSIVFVARFMRIPRLNAASRLER